MFKTIIEKLNTPQNYFSCHILLYHATYNNLPDLTRNNIHNIKFSVFKKQIEWIKENFDIVTIDELFELDKIRGKACITFDDAYSSIFQNAIPYLIENNIPSTVYLNKVTFENKLMWRDKIRMLISNELVEKFIDFEKKYYNNNYGLNKKNFYRRSKKNTINSKILDNILDEYIKSNNIEIKYLRNNLYITNPELLIKDELVTYGNHTYNHYVLSSLSHKDQKFEIEENTKFIDSLDLNKTNTFSIPFGGSDFYNIDTLNILSQLGYENILLSGHNINFDVNYRKFGLKMFKRYMPPSNYYLFHKYILKKLYRNYPLYLIRKI